MDQTLWWIIGIVAALVVLGAIVPEVYGRSVRRRQKQLSHRPKRRIRL